MDIIQKLIIFYIELADMSHGIDYKPWKDGVSDENILALAELTADLAARLDYFADEYVNGNVEGKRLIDTMNQGKRAIEAKEHFWPDYDPEDGYMDTELDEVVDDEYIEQALSEIEPGSIDVRAGFEYDSRSAEEARAYSSGPTKELEAARSQYYDALQKVKELDIDVIVPQLPE